eukprot:12924211-Ditylum_brightwellii.AAC.1
MVIVLTSIISKLIVVMAIKYKLPVDQIGQSNYHVVAKGDMGWVSVESSMISSTHTKGSSLEDGIAFIIIGRSNAAIKILH